MASARGRGAQVRLDGDEQAAARGALGGVYRLVDHIQAKQIIEDAGIAAKGNNADGSPGSGAPALDEVLTPGGRVAGYIPSKLPTTPGGPNPDPGTDPDPNPDPDPDPGTDPGPGTGPPPTPNPAPAQTIFLRDGEAVKDRLGNFVTFRAAVIVVPPPDPEPGTDPPPPVVIPPPVGALSGRDGGVISLRDGSYLRQRIAADAPPPDPSPDPEPEPVPEPTVGTYPAGPHLRLTSLHSGVIIEYQDGTNATIRLVRPLYINNQLFAADTFNTGSTYATNIFWTARLGYLTIQGGNAAVERDVVSTDDGTYTTEVLRAMSDGTFLELKLTWKVSPLATGTPPAPSPVPNRLTQIYFEDFKAGTGTASLSRAWGDVTNPGGYLRLRNLASAMTQTSPTYNTRGDYGFGNGLYEFRCKFYGIDNGGSAGPAIVLWPSSDVWPGPEVDLGELFGPNGNGTRSTFYSANHWKDASKPVENNGQNQAKIWPVEVPGFNFNEEFTTACLIDNDKIIFLMNGVEYARDAVSPVPKDFANGGENHTVGLLSQSETDSLGNPSGLDCFWIRWTPTALLP